MHDDKLRQRVPAGVVSGVSSLKAPVVRLALRSHELSLPPRREIASRLLSSLSLVRLGLGASVVWRLQRRPC